MKKHLFTLAAVLTGSVLLSVGTYAQTVSEIVSKHIAALGGQDALKAFKSAKYTQSTIAPGQTIDATATVIFDKAARINMNMMGNDITVVTKGETGWVKQGSDAPRDIPAAQLKIVTDNMMLPGLELATASAKGEKIDLKGKETVDGQSVYALTTTVQGQPATVYIDPTTYLITGRKGKVSAMGQTIDASIAYDDYRKAGALTLPYRAKTEAMGQAATVKLTAFEANPSVDESIFEKPKQ
ncbi:hypothetical protein [Fibrella aestuarina]|nr:hypothetical protein [Fibrella aestuarina]